MSTEIVKSPMLLLQEQLDRGVSVQDLKALMDMAERWNDKQAEQAWTRAMMACQRDMPPLVKSGHNTHKDIWYARFETLDRQIRPIYLRECLTLCFTEIPQDKPEICRMALDVRHVDGYEKRFMKDVHVDGVGAKGNANMTATQGDGSTASYARRYVTKLAFNLVDEIGEDVDGDVATQGRISEAEAKLVRAAISETTFTTGKPVDHMALMEFAARGLKKWEDLNREQYVRVLNELGLRRQTYIEEKRKAAAKR